MKLLRIISTYPAYNSHFYGNRPNLAEADFETQRAVLSSDYFSSGQSLSLALQSLGYEVLEIYPKLQAFQRAWARSEGLNDSDPINDLIVAQVKRSKPEILLYEHYDAALLQRIRNEIDSIKFVIGWEGSALSSGRAWPHLNAIVSCAPETVEHLRGLGLRSELVGHAFDGRINQLLAPTREVIPTSFVGSIVRRNRFHLERERLLLEMVRQIPIQIFSPTMEVRWQDYVKAAVAGGAYVGMRVMSFVRLSGYAKKRFALVRQADRFASVPRTPVHPVLLNHSRPGVYGLDFFQVIRDSLISLNIHADSSPRFASNMRLYEATGVGSCLLTDWRPNLNQLFDTDKEVVSYRSAAEAVEKARWLLDHPTDRAEIARRGQERTLRDYTFLQQARRLDEIINELCKQSSIGRSKHRVTLGGKQIKAGVGYH
jgi:hypothetical protein